MTAGSLLLGLGALVLLSPRKRSKKKSSKKGSYSQSVVADVMQWLPLARDAHRAYPTVPLATILSVIHIESGGNPLAQNPSGAQGLMQVKSAYQRENGIYNWRDPRQAIFGGVKILAAQIARAKKLYGGRMDYALACYNRGPGTVAKVGLDATALEYIARYKAAYPNYQGVR